MKIFLTGATGYIGSAVARRLLQAGHAVSGLTRSLAKFKGLSACGMRPVAGDLRWPSSYMKEADDCDVLIHSAFEYGAESAAVDRQAVEALVSSARASGKPRLIVYTSGVWVLGPSRADPADEESPLDPPSVVAWRPAHERLVLDAAGGRVAAAVVRPGCVYGGCGGLYGLMLKSIFERRAARVVGDGGNSWASVYLDDLAELYSLLVERRPERALYHATDGSADSVGAVAEAFLEAAGGGSLERQPLESARLELGPVAEALAMDQRVSSARARRELGWRPRLASAARSAEALLAEWHEKAAHICVS